MPPMPEICPAPAAKKSHCRMEITEQQSEEKKKKKNYI